MGLLGSAEDPLEFVIMSLKEQQSAWCFSFFSHVELPGGGLCGVGGELDVTRIGVCTKQCDEGEGGYKGV